MQNITLKAQKYATDKHFGQERDDGQPYIVHPSRVAGLISLIGGDDAMVAAAWLHDTVEDTDTTYEDLVREFGTEIADLVMEVTHEGDDTHGYYFPRLETERGVMLKFADRLANLSTMGDAWSEKRRAHYLKKSKFWKSEA